ncbi:MAG TPA: protein kinase [Candidatus Solibacter sp.]
MTGEAWNQVRSLFGAMLELAPAERDAALARLKHDDPEAAAEVRRLIGNFEEAKSFLEQPVTPDWQQALSAAAPQVLRAGETVAGRYEIRRLLGAGGMGEVYEAWDREMRMALALKVLPPQFAGRPEMVERFLKEVYLAREIAHPGVCKTYDLGRGAEAGTPLFFLTMELIEGETLAQRLARGPIPISEGEALLTEAAEAIAAAHRLNVIHRDLKPGNVMLRCHPLASGHRVAIMDFGLAKGKSPGSLEVSSATRQQVGTPQYMAPEQLANDPVTKATDVYAFGLIAYEVLTGRRPLDREPPLAALIKRTKSAPPEARSVAGAIPSLWNAVIARCLEPDPRARFADAVALTEVLSSSRKMRRRVLFPRAITRRQIAMTLGATVVAAAAWKWSELWRDARVAAGTRVLLAPAANATGEPELDGLAVAFAAEIQQSAHLAFSQPEDHAEELRLILKRPGDRLDARSARHLALRAQIPLVLFATLGRVGSDYVFDVTLERVDPATEQAAATWPNSFRAAGQRQLHTALFDAARWLRRATGESESSIADLGKRPEEVTTDSWEALREFSKAQSQAETDLPGAIVTLDAAARRDPLFAMAHMRRGDYLVRLNRFAEGYDAWHSAMAALDQRPISRREELMIRAMYADDMQSCAQAADYYKELMRVYPHLDYPWRYVSSPLMKLGRIEESIAVMQQLIARTGGGRWNHWRKLLDYNAIAGHAAEARAAWEEMQRRRPPPGETELAAFMLHAASGSDQEAEQSIRAALAKLADAGRSKYTTTYAHWLADRERLEEAARLLGDSLLSDARAGRVAERSRKLVSWAAIEARVAGPKPVKAACLEAIDLDHGPQRVRRAAVVLARNGFADEASRAAKFLDAAGGQPLGMVGKAVAEAEIRLFRGAPSDALRLLEPVAALRSHTESRLEYARALAGTDNTTEAIRQLEDSLRYRHAEWAAADLAVPLDYRDLRFLLNNLRNNA